MKIDPRHLVQIAAIVESGGMTEAAALLGTTQPALSRTVAMLEKRLGTPLFLRDRRPLQPTPLCRELANQGAAIHRAAERASNSADAFRAGELGAVRLGGTPFFTDALISAMIAEFQTRHPNVRVDQSYGYTNELVAKVRGGQLDLAICPIELLDIDSDLSFEEILPGRNVVACRAGHPLLSRRPLRPVALLDYPWIEPPPGSPLSADLRTALIGLGAERIRISYSGGSLASLLNHMRHSDSLAVLPHSVVFAIRKQGEISALPMKLDHPPRALGVLQSRALAPLPAAHRFAVHVKTAFAELKDQIRRHERIIVWGRA